MLQLHALSESIEVLDSPSATESWMVMNARSQS